MPEGPEVRIMAEGLHNKCANRFCYGIYVNERSRYYTKPFEPFDKDDWVPESNGLIFIPLNCTLVRVFSKGKKIIFDFNKFYAISSLSMEGHWGWTPEDHSGLIMQFDSFNAYFSDTRHFGTFALAFPQDITKHLKNVGPEYLTGEVTLEMFLDKARNKPNLQVTSFLMNQDIFSGIGNYLKSEVLFRARISPYLKMGQIDELRLTLLYNVIINTILESYHKRGLTIATYKDTEGNTGQFECQVYKKNNFEGHPVVKVELDDKRTTHWVPTLQY